MLSYPDRFRFKTAPPKGSRLMFVWFVFLLLVAVLSVGMLVAAIVQAEETTNKDILVGYPLIVASSAVRHSTGPRVRSMAGSAWVCIGRSSRTSKGESCRNSGDCLRSP